MKEYGSLEVTAIITFYDVSTNDTDTLEELVYDKISALGNCEISTNVEDVDETDVSIRAKIEAPAVHDYLKPSWDDYGGDPGYDEIESKIDADSIKEAFESNVYVYVKSEEFVAA